MKTIWLSLHLWLNVLGLAPATPLEGGPPAGLATPAPDPSPVHDSPSTEPPRGEVRIAGAPAVRGDFALRTTPPGARTYVNGRLLGRTPIRQRNFTSRGPLKVEIRAEGYVTEVCDIQPDQLRQGVKLYFELTPLPPTDQCTGQAGELWLKLLERESISPEGLHALRRCFTGAGNWPGVEKSVRRLLELERSGLLHYDLARAHYQQGTPEHYAGCVSESGQALRQGRLDPCLRWRAQHLRIVCLVHFEHRGWRTQPLPEQAPQAGELLATLRNELDNQDPATLRTPADQACLEEMKREVGRMERSLEP